MKDTRAILLVEDNADDEREARDETDARPLVVIALDDRRYALPLARVLRSIRVVAITPLPGAPPIVLGIIDLAGAVLPVIDIRRRFGHAPRDVRLSDHLVVALAGRRAVALLVDETTGVAELPAGAVVPAGEILPGLGLVEGAMRLQDGLVLIHDLERLLSLEEDAEIDRALLSRHARLAADRAER